MEIKSVDKRTIYTIGSSNHSPEEFIRLLRTYHIQIVVDVRRFPTSKFDHFKKESLEDLLEENEIDYCYLGKGLGGYRKEGYETYLKTKDFQESLEVVKKIARTKTTTLMCSERFPWRCHRRFIARVLQDQGWQVIHIIDEKRTWTPRPVPAEI